MSRLLRLLALGSRSSPPSLAAAEQASFDFSVAGIRVGALSMASEQSGVGLYRDEPDRHRRARRHVRLLLRRPGAPDAWPATARWCRRDYAATSKSPRALRQTQDRLGGRRAGQRLGRAAARERARPGRSRAGRSTRSRPGSGCSAPPRPTTVCGATVDVFDGSRRSRLKPRRAGPRRRGAGLRRHLRPDRGRGAQHGRPARVPVHGWSSSRTAAGSTGWSGSRRRPTSARRCCPGRGEARNA